MINIEQEYATLIHSVLGNLKALDKLEDSQEKEQAIQHVITQIEFALEELNPDVATESTTIPTVSNKLYAVRQLLDAQLPDASVLAQIKAKLLITTLDVTRTPIVLYAPTGSGKSLIAAHLAHDEAILAAYPDGIFWLNLGQYADINAAYQSIATAFGRSIPGLIEEEAMRQYMQNLLAAQHCLFIVDDAMDIESILAFHDLAQHCRLLITSHIDNLYEFVRYTADQAILLSIEPPELKQALSIFKHALQQQNVAPPDNATGKALLTLLGYSPLALKLLVGLASVQKPLNWATLYQSLQEDDWEFPVDHDPLLMRCLHLYVQVLGDDGECYAVLAVFENYTHIPQNTVVLLWQYMFNLEKNVAIALIQHFVEQGLLGLYQDNTLQQTYLSMHHFQHAYIQDIADLDNLHKHLLAAYGRLYQQNWLNVDNDGYFYQHLCLHLAGAGRHKELKSLLLDFDWLSKKLNYCHFPALLNDYVYLDGDADSIQVQHALFSSGEVLAKDKTLLATVLLDKLWTQTDSKDIQALLNQARESVPAWELAMPENDEVVF